LSRWQRKKIIAARLTKLTGFAAHEFMWLTLLPQPSTIAVTVLLFFLCPLINFSVSYCLATFAQTLGFPCSLPSSTFTVTVHCNPRQQHVKPSFKLHMHNIQLSNTWFKTCFCWIWRQQQL
jgi:hypothetical protein